MPVIIFGFLQLSGQKEFILSKYVSDKNWTTIEQNATTTQLKGADFIEIFGKTYQSGARIDSKLGNPAYAAIYYL
ncbi:MAG: hypothetical protein QM532_01200 [Cyanobium sp. MAG06]|nr:hypothetical protein [Cyanobium sp. MAG06]